MKKILLSILLLFALIVFASPINSDKYFQTAEKMQKKYNPKNKDYVIIIDFTKNLFADRLFLLDMKNKKVVLSCRVTHAYKSGYFYAKEFSNNPGTEKSCYGAFLTEYSRPGKYGYSMEISGLDKGINDKERSRNIIFHPTTVLWYKGCFATSKENNKKIIDLTKDGSLVYVIK